MKADLTAEQRLGIVRKMNQLKAPWKKVFHAFQKDYFKRLDIYQKRGIDLDLVK